MKALTKISKTPKDWRIIEKPIPAYDADQVLIRVEYIGICGSDIHTFEGHYNQNAENLTIGRRRRSRQERNQRQSRRPRHQRNYFQNLRQVSLLQGRSIQSLLHA